MTINCLACLVMWRIWLLEEKTDCFPEVSLLLNSYPLNDSVLSVLYCGLLVQHWQYQSSAFQYSHICKHIFLKKLDPALQKI